MATIGQVCYSHEYCTDCPARKQCSIRPLFYSEPEYQNWKTTTYLKIEQFVKPFVTPSLYASISFNVCLEMLSMEVRKQRELELHPEYSPE